MAGWFEGGEVFGDVRDQFLAAFRKKIAAEPPSGIKPEDTAFVQWTGALVLELDIRDLGTQCRLHIGYFLNAARPHLQCEWSFSDYILDGGPWKNPSPEASGHVDDDVTAAFDWLSRELARPLLEARWGRAVTWRFEEPSEVIGRSGFSLRRLFRRPPDSTIRLR